MADRVDATVAAGTRRWQEIASGEYAPESYSVNAVTAAVAKQKFFVAGTGALVLTAAGDARCTVSNPTGSGVNVFLARLSLFSNAAGEASLLINPTTGLPATAARPQLNAVIGAAAGVAVVKADTDAVTALGGGTDTGVVLAFPAATRISVDLPPFILSPGVTLGINIPVSAASSRTFMSIYYWQE